MRTVVAMNLLNLANTHFGIWFALFVARKCPPAVGHRVARFVAERMADRKNSFLVRTIRANQQVVRGWAPDAVELEDVARDVLTHHSRFLYDFYHNRHDPVATERLVRFDPHTMEMIERMREEKAGTIVVSPHLGNFDLTAQAACGTRVRAQVVTLNHAKGAYRLQDALRSRPNLEIAPASVQVMKRAIQRLRVGGNIITGVERPMPESRYRPVFCGRPAALPVHYVYLALKTGVPIWVISARQDSDGFYNVKSTGPIEVQHYADHEKDLVINAEHILEVAAGYIREAPEQWSMFYPVWG